MSTKINPNKVILLGNTGVGKTSIFLRVKDGVFYPDTTVTLNGADFILKKFQVDDAEINLQIWDTAGMERYRSPTDSYFRNCKAVVFVYSITNKQSFHELSSNWDVHVTRFEDMHAQRVGASHKPCRRFLLANKIDLADEQEDDEIALKSLCDKIYIQEYFKVSAKTGEGIDTAFQRVAEVLANPDRFDSAQDDTINLGLENETGRKCGC